MPTYRYGIDPDYVAKLTRRRPRPSPVPGNPNSPAFIELFNGGDVPTAIDASVLDTTTPNAIELMDAASPVTTIDLTVAGGPEEPPPPSGDYVAFTLHRLRAGTGATHHAGALPLPRTGEGMTLSDADVAGNAMKLVEVMPNGTLVEVARTAAALRRARLDGTLTSVFLRFDAGTLSEGATKSYRLYKVGRTLADPVFGALPSYTRTAAVWDVYPDTVAVPSVDILRKSGVVGPFVFPSVAQAATASADFGALDTAWEADAEVWQDHTKVFPGGDGAGAEESALDVLLPTDPFWVGQGEGAWQAHIYLTIGFYDTPLHYFHRYVRTGDVKWFKLACAQEWVLLEEGYKTRAPAWGAGEPYMSYSGAGVHYEFTGLSSGLTFIENAANTHYSGGSSSQRFANMNVWKSSPGTTFGEFSATSLRECARVLLAFRLAHLYKVSTAGTGAYGSWLALWQAGFARMLETGSDRCWKLTLSGSGGIYRDKDCPSPNTAQPDQMFVNSFMHGIYGWELIEARRTLALTAGEGTSLNQVIDRITTHLMTYRYFFGTSQYVGFANGWNYDCFSYDVSSDIINLNHFYVGLIMDAATRGTPNTSGVSATLSAALSINNAQKYRQYAVGNIQPGPGDSVVRSRKQWNEMSTYMAPYFAMALGDS